MWLLYNARRAGGAASFRCRALDRSIDQGSSFVRSRWTRFQQSPNPDLPHSKSEGPNTAERKLQELGCLRFSGGPYRHRDAAAATGTGAIKRCRRGEPVNVSGRSMRIMRRADELKRLCRARRPWMPPSSRRAPSEMPCWRPRARALPEPHIWPFSSGSPRGNASRRGRGFLA